jgi:hypothetical protein
MKGAMMTHLSTDDKEHHISSHFRPSKEIGYLYCNTCKKILYQQGNGEELLKEDLRK